MGGCGGSDGWGPPQMGGVRRNTFSTVGTSPFVVEREHLEGTLESTL